jgi:hypothetical protein
MAEHGPPGEPKGEIRALAGNEQWSPVGRLGFFEVSSWGRVRASRTGRIKPPTVAKSGFMVVNLYAAGRSSVRNVHSVVAEAFLGPRPSRMMVGHRDGDRRNNRPENLEYRPLGQRSPNGWSPWIESKNGRKLSRAEADEIRRRAGLGGSTTALAEEFGISAPMVSSIKHGRRWPPIERCAPDATESLR